MRLQDTGRISEKYCGFGVIQASAIANPAVVAKQEKPQMRVLPVLAGATPIKPPSPEFLLEAVHKQFTVGALGKDVKAMGSDGLQLNLRGIQLKKSINGFTVANAGFPKLPQALERVWRPRITGLFVMTLIAWE